MSYTVVCKIFYTRTSHNNTVLVLFSLKINLYCTGPDTEGRQTKGSNHTIFLVTTFHLTESFCGCISLTLPGVFFLWKLCHILGLLFSSQTRTQTHLCTRLWKLLGLWEHGTHTSKKNTATSYHGDLSVWNTFCQSFFRHNRLCVQVGACVRHGGQVDGGLWERRTPTVSRTGKPR